MQTIKGLLLRGVLCVASLLPFVAEAQERVSVLRHNCLQETADGTTTRGMHRLPSLKTDWDANREYRQMVVLIEFSDSTFTMDNPREFYDRLFNEEGFTDSRFSRADGSVADYFRDQSGGLFNVKFDVYGPVRVSSKAKRSSSQDKGSNVFKEATKKVLDSLKLEVAPYDWNGDQEVEQVIVVYAGPSGNVLGQEGFIWPNTGTFASITSKDGKSVRNYSASPERFSPTSNAGIGTICHEYSHCFGLPDIYPTWNNMPLSVVDEWDLMDGGNFSGRGWCPPSYTGLEKILLGWGAAIELSEPQTIEGMKPVSEGGEFYLVRHTDTEYLLLENHQWTGWDKYNPGHGLVVYHVDYDASNWFTNYVNNSRSGQWGFCLVSADNQDYQAWDKLLADDNPYVDGHSKILSGSPYPYYGLDGYVNAALTDDSTPAAKMYHSNATGKKQLGKAITNVRMSDDGLISFDFMGGTTPQTAIAEVKAPEAKAWYDLQGRRVKAPSQRGLYIANGKKIIIK